MSADPAARRGSDLATIGGGLLTGLRVLLVGLIVAATAAFVIGVSIERSRDHAPSGEPTSTSSEAAGSSEGAAHSDGDASISPPPRWRP